MLKSKGYCLFYGILPLVVIASLWIKIYTAPIFPYVSMIYPIIRTIVLGLVSVTFLLRALYLYMLDSPKGRRILSKIPFAWVKRKVAEYE